eukprot:4950304-Pyramimonas_sp.AAC.1
MLVLLSVVLPAALLVPGGALEVTLPLVCDALLVTEALEIPVVDDAVIVGLAVELAVGVALPELVLAVAV